MIVAVSTFIAEFSTFRVVMLTLGAFHYLSLELCIGLEKNMDRMEISNRKYRIINSMSNSMDHRNFQYIQYFYQYYDLD